MPVYVDTSMRYIHGYMHTCMHIFMYGYLRTFAHPYVDTYMDTRMDTYVPLCASIGTYLTFLILYLQLTSGGLELGLSNAKL